MASSSHQGGLVAGAYSEKKEDLLLRVYEFWTSNHDNLPAADKDISWNVYWFYKNYLKHYTLVFKSRETGEAFLIGLVKDDIAGPNPKITMDFKVIDFHDPHYCDLEQNFIGTIRKCAYNIFSSGMSV